MGQLVIFISYTWSDGREYAIDLRDWLRDRFSVEPFLDRDQAPGHSFQRPVEEAIRGCDVLLFILTKGSTQSDWCQRELSLAQRIGKRVLPLLHDADAELLELEGLTRVDFTTSPDQGWDQLGEALERIDSPAARLESLRKQRRIVERKAAQASGAGRERFEAELAELDEKLRDERERAEDPETRSRQVTEEIRAGQARERASDAAPVNRSGVRFVNEPPPLLPGRFLDRLLETQRLERHLGDPATRLVAVVGAGGIGKTAMVSRLLGGLLRGTSELPVDAFVYLPADGSRPIGPSILLEDLSKVAPGHPRDGSPVGHPAGSDLSSTDKVDRVLDLLSGARVLVVVDNAEDLLDRGGRLQDPDLEEVFRALVGRPDHGVKLVLGTRAVPTQLLRVLPGNTVRLDLDEGLPPEDIHRFLCELDSGELLGLRRAARADLKRLRELTGGNPRGLEMLFSLLKSEPDLILPELLDELQQLPPDQGVLDHLAGRMLDRLDRVDRRVLQALAVYARPVRPVAVDYLLQPYLEGFTSERTLRRLLARRLVRRDGERFHVPRAPDGEHLLAGIPPGSAADRGRDPLPLTQVAMLDRAADYFVGTRKRHVEHVDDLSPQFAEIDLRMRGRDYRRALRLIHQIDDEYLRGWGQGTAVAAWREQLRGNLSDPRLELVNLSWLAHARRLQEDLTQAIDLLEEAISRSRRLGDGRGRLRLTIYLGTTRLDHGEVARAARAYRSGLRGARIRRMLLLQAMARTGLLQCCSETGHFKRALRHHDAAVALLDRIPDLSGPEAERRERADLRGRLFLHGGWIHLHRGDDGEALELLRAGLKHARGLDAQRLEGHLLNAEAQVLIEGHAADAVAPAAEAVALGARIRSPRLSREANTTLALAHLCAGDLVAAGEAADAAARYRGTRRALWALALQGVTAFRAGQQEKARLALLDADQQARTLRKRGRRSFQVLDVHGAVLCGLALCGDPDKFREAIEVYNRARRAARAPGAVRRSLRLLDQLSLGRGAGELADVRRAAAGER